MQYIFKPFIYVFIFYVCIFLFYQYLPYHHYIFLKLETDHHNLKEHIIAGCSLSSCTLALISYKCIPDITFNNSIYPKCISFLITTLKLRGGMTS